MDVKMQPYKKKYNHSYTIGVYPTLELLTYHPQTVVKVLLGSKGEKNSGAQKIIDICRKNNIKTEINDGSINKLSDSENNYALGFFSKFTTTLSDKEDHLVLVNPSDMGNLGTIVRTMVGFNITNLSIINPAADIFNPKVIRASMGGIFQINFQNYDSFELYKKTFRFHHFYPFITNAEEELDSVNFQRPAALIFGNEGSGLGKQFANLGNPIKITQSERVDSLNLSIAVGIGLYSYFKKNSK